MKAIDLFAGAGGSTTGMVRAGWQVVWAANHWPDAVRVHALNHPDTEHVVQDLQQADFTRLPQYDALWASPSCLPPEAQIEMADGSRKQIVELAAGDEVLTHKGRSQRVVRVWTKRFTGQMIHLTMWGDSKHPICMTQDHRVWVRRRRSKSGALGLPEWVRADQLAPGDYVSFPRPVPVEGTARAFVAALEPATIEYTLGPNRCSGRKDYPARTSSMPGAKVFLDGASPDLWWLIGHYLGDGQARIDRPQVGWSTGASGENLQRVQQILKRLGLSSWLAGDEGNRSVFCSSTHLHAICTAFGRLCGEKAVPGTLWTLEHVHLRALLAGYFAADGSIKAVHGKPVYRATSVSLELLQGLQRLCWGLGWSASISVCDRARKRTILGRPVSCQASWEISVRQEPHAQSRTKFDLDKTHVWRSIHTSKATEVVKHSVYDMEVEEDHSFCLPGIVVHNCQGHSNAASGGGRYEKRGTAPAHDWLRATAWAAITAAEVTRPPVCIIENVEELRGWCLWPSWLHAWQALGYAISEQVINAADLGVPQDRPRLFIIAVRGATPLRLDAPRLPRVAMRGAFDLDGGGWLPLRRCAPGIQVRVQRAIARNGFVGAFHTQSVSDNAGRDLGRPAPVITTKHQHGLVRGRGEWHRREYRPLHLIEYQRLMGFPEDYRLGNVGVSKGCKLLGNAVCPPVATWICEQLQARL